MSENNDFVAWMQGLPHTTEITHPPDCVMTDALRHTIASELSPMWIRHDKPELPLVGRLISDGETMFYLTGIKDDGTYTAYRWDTVLQWYESRWWPLELDKGVDVYRMTSLMSDTDRIAESRFSPFCAVPPVLHREFVYAARIVNLPRHPVGALSDRVPTAHLLCELHGVLLPRNATVPPGFRVTVQNGFGWAGHSTAGIGIGALDHFPDLVMTTRNMDNDDAILDTVAEFVADELTRHPLDEPIAQPIFRRSFRRSSWSSVFLNKAFELPGVDDFRLVLLTVTPIIGRDYRVVVPEGVNLCHWPDFLNSLNDEYTFTTADLVDWLFSIGVHSLFMFDNSCSRLDSEDGMVVSKALATQANYDASRKHLSQRIIDEHPGVYGDTSPTFSVSPMDDDAAGAPTPVLWGAKGGRKTRRPQRQRRTRHRRRNFFARVRKAKK